MPNPKSFPNPKAFHPTLLFSKAKQKRSYGIGKPEPIRRGPYCIRLDNVPLCNGIWPAWPRPVCVTFLLRYQDTPMRHSNGFCVRGK